MKYTTTIALFATLTTSASAFAPRQQNVGQSSSTLRKMSDFNYNNDMSEALPFQKRPHMLDGSMPGDVGFDPIGFAGTEADLWKYREAEVKHGRLAMLAAVGWPLAELFDRKIANIFALDPIVDASNRNPSILNGGLGKISPLYWLVCLGAAAAIDIKGIEKANSNDPNYFPGNLEWDPLGLYPEDKAGRFRMQLAEIKHGRLAMIAITAFAFQEFVQDFAVVDQTPIFFHPAQDVVDKYGVSGELTPQL